MRRFPLRAASALAFITIFFLCFSSARADVTGVVRGQVTVHGTPADGVTVTLRGEQSVLEATTDADGNFVFPRVPFGRYTLTAHSAGHPDATADVQVATNSVATVDLRISPLQEIARTTVTTRGGVSGTPVSENTLGRATIEALPQGQSLNRLVATVPGVVQFSYNEPVAHGFHGLTYEIDGAPIPQATSANFSEILDPRNINSLEVFTGAFPAEFGGQRQGAVVNIITKREGEIPTGAQFSLGGGTYGSVLGSVSDGIDLGKTHLFLNGNLQTTTRGIDTPAKSAMHDNASVANQFARVVSDLGAGNSLAFDFSNQFNAFQIPINTTASDSNPIVNLPTQDDVQREYNSFANLNFTHTSADGNGYFQVIPWWRTTRIVFAGDLPSDVLALDTSATDCAPGPPPCNLGGLSQDRHASYLGLRSAYFRSNGHHALKIGADFASENFTSSETIALAGSAPFFDNVTQHGSAYSAYIEDKWTPSSVFSMQAGLRYDFSNGFVQGNELQPRIEANYRLGPATVAHAYYGRVYAAPTLEDTRREAVVVGGGSPGTLPIYDLKPERDSYYEIGLAQTFRGGLYGYLNAWERNAWNVLDTTQIFPTPIFAVFNNSLGIAHGLELRLEQRGATDSWFVSGTLSHSIAGGISGSTFLFPPSAISNISLQPEDHDQTVAINDAYTKRFGNDRRTYATLGSDYGTGYPVQFQNGPGRLPPHLTFNAAFGRTPAKGSLGYSLSALNVTNYQYLLKVSNGFNTTQWAPGLKLILQLSAAM